jgi:hypothetical protein
VDSKEWKEDGNTHNYHTKSPTNWSYLQNTSPGSSLLRKVKTTSSYNAVPYFINTAVVLDICHQETFQVSYLSMYEMLSLQGTNITTTHG